PDRPVILLLGGEDKNTALEELITRALEHCRLVICYGAAAGRFFEAFDAVDPGRSGCQLLQAGGMREAFQAAVDASLPGDIVLLSPSCSSFDEFDSFEDRGRVFKLMVAEQAAMGQR
ncbi:MAG: UDP-N-acetylmuramoyl-L-alanine--D-glutamate ligase, partial [Coriobacteriia bacterium]|nr:UDP-N-acetylmuramoyl-L-alanine--D-glutamate ligase [Coriobacteriia bacterium]